jgi:FeS assembly SUF system protein
MSSIPTGDMRRGGMAGEPGLDAFMPDIGMEEPDWIHVKAPGGDPAGPHDPADLKEAIIDNLTQIHDPEIPVNIWDLGLIYELDVDDAGHAKVIMTLTAPNCPVAGSMPKMVEKGVRNVPGITGCDLELTWDPPWSLEKASEDARLALGM